MREGGRHYSCRGSAAARFMRRLGSTRGRGHRGGRDGRLSHGRRLPTGVQLVLAGRSSAGCPVGARPLAGRVWEPRWESRRRGRAGMRPAWSVRRRVRRAGRRACVPACRRAAARTRRSAAGSRGVQGSTVHVFGLSRRWRAAPPRRVPARVERLDVRTARQLHAGARAPLCAGAHGGATRRRAVRCAHARAATAPRRTLARTIASTRSGMLAIPDALTFGREGSLQLLEGSLWVAATQLQEPENGPADSIVSSQHGPFCLATQG
jgi:hypothetical protein